MSSINVVRKITLIENFLCVFRNYLFFKQKHRILINLLIFAVTCLHLFDLVLFYRIAQMVIENSYLNIMKVYSFIMYYLFSVINSLLAIILGFLNAKPFKIYCDCMDDIYESCKGDVAFLKTVTRPNKRVILVVTVVTTLVLVRTIDDVFQLFESSGNVDTITFAVWVFLDTTLQHRFIVESLTFYVLIGVIVFCLKYLTSSIAVATEKLKGPQSVNEEFLELEHDLARWWSVSQHLSECCHQLTSCFGLQIAIMICTTTMYYILLLYRIVYTLTITQPAEITISARRILIFLSEYGTVTLLIVTSGQHLCNEADKLDAAVAMLCNLLEYSKGLGAERCGDAARALARRLRAAPLRVKLLSRPVQAALLTAVLAATADYAIILLQFNHVV